MSVIKFIKKRRNRFIEELKTEIKICNIDTKENYESVFYSNKEVVFADVSPGKYWYSISDREKCETINVGVIVVNKDQVKECEI